VVFCLLSFAGKAQHMACAVLRQTKKVNLLSCELSHVREKKGPLIFRPFRGPFCGQRNEKKRRAFCSGSFRISQVQGYYDVKAHHNDKKLEKEKE
jgi:hypothetical protein